MTFEELQDLLAEQFSCDTGDLSRGTALADLGADHEDMIELAWAPVSYTHLTLPTT